MTEPNQFESSHISSLEELRAQPGIDVLHSTVGEIGESFADLPLAQINSQWDAVRMDDDMMEDGLRFDQISAYWCTIDPLPEFFGEYRLPEPFEIAAQPPDPAADTVPEGVQRDFMLQLKRIDNAYRSGVGSSTYIRIAPNQTPLEVWHHDFAQTGGDPYPYGYVQLDLTYREYLETLILTKGTRGWQYLFADVSFRRGPLGDIGDHVAHMLDVFPDLFPHHDYSALQRRWEDRQ